MNTDQLNGDGAGPPRQSFLTAEYIRQIVANPVYRGVVRIREQAFDQSPSSDKSVKWLEFQGRQPPIVEDALYFKANRAIALSAEKRPRQIRERTGPCVGLLQGLLVCTHCDAAMSPGIAMRRKPSGDPHRYYRCNQLVKGAKQCLCTTRQISADAIETILVSLIQSVESNQASFARLGYETANSARDREIAQLNAELLEVDALLAEQRKALSKFVEFIRNGESGQISRHVIQETEAVDREINKLELRRVAIETKLYRRSAKVPSIAELGDAFAKVGRALSVGSFLNKRDIFKDVIKEVRLHRIHGVTEGGVAVKKRTFRATVEFRTNRLLAFGVTTIDSSFESLGYRDVALKTTFEIHSNKKQQRVILFEQGFAAVSSTYRQSGNIHVGTVTPSDENPIQRALRWRTLMSDGEKSAVTLAQEEQVSKGLVSQILDLLDLPQVIVDFLREGRDKQLVKRISTRELQRLRSLPMHEAIAQFQARVAGLPVQQTLLPDPSL